MPSIWLDKCCLCIPLRVGTFITGYLLTVLHALIVVVSTINLVKLMEVVIGDHVLRSPVFLTLVIIQYCALTLFVVRFIFSIILIVGLHKRKWSLVRLFYIAFIIIMILYLIMYAVCLILYAKNYSIRHWLIQLPDMVLSLFSIYSIFVVKRWHNIMKNQIVVNQKVAYKAKKTETV